MKNYYLSDIEKSDFIESYKIENEKIIIYYANKTIKDVPFTTYEIEKINQIMEEQAMQFYKRFPSSKDPEFSDISGACLFYGSLSCIPMAFVNKKTTFLPVFIGVMINFTLLTLRRYEMYKEYKKLDIYFSVAKNINEIFECFKKLEKILDEESKNKYNNVMNDIYKGLKKKLIEDIKSRNDAVMSINTLNYLNYNDIEKLINNIFLSAEKVKKIGKREPTIK